MEASAASHLNAAAQPVLMLTTQTVPRLQLCELVCVVRAGHFFDPPHCQGLAHLLEHMLFLGSEGLSDPNQILTELTVLGGQLNAMTGPETTCFHLTAPTENFAAALGLFGNFLARPLFLLERIDQEIDNIHEEFLTNRHDVGRRFHDVRRTLCNPKHPMHMLSVGNHTTLRVAPLKDVQALLCDMHQRHYCQQNLSLALRVPKTQTDWETQITTVFAQLNRGKAIIPHWPAVELNRYAPALISLHQAQPQTQLSCHFSLSLSSNSPLQPMIDILVLWLGDESPNTFVSWCKQQGFATTVIAGRGIAFPEYCEIVITLTLNQHEHNVYNAIIKALFSYLARLTVGCDEQWRFDQAQQALRLMTGPNDLTQLALALLTPPTSIETQPYANPADRMRALLQMLNPTNLMVFLTGANVQTTQVSPHYLTPYAITLLDALDYSVDYDSLLYQQLNLPPPNPYLLEPNISSEPPRPATLHHTTSFYSQPGLQLWLRHHQDTPEQTSDIFLSIEHPNLVSSPVQAAVKKIALNLISQQLQHRCFNAAMAGMQQHCYGHQAGFTLHAHGPITSLMSFFLDTLAIVPDLPLTPVLFAQAQQQLIAQCHSHLYAKPINRLLTRLTSFLQPTTYAPDELENALTRLDFDTFERLWSPLDGKAFAEGLLYGNWHLNEAEDFATQIYQKLPLGGMGPLPRETVTLPAASVCIESVFCEQQDAAVVLCVQPTCNSINTTLFCMLLEQLLATPFFNYMRNNEKAAYLVGSGYTEHNRHASVIFYAQSGLHNTQQLLDKIQEGIKQLLPSLLQHRQHWGKVKHILQRQLSPQHYPPGMEARQAWANLDYYRNPAATPKRLVAALTTFSFEDFHHYLQHLVQKKDFSFVVMHTRDHQYLDKQIHYKGLAFS